MINDWQRIGRVVQLQIQVKSMKQTLPDGIRIYQPEKALHRVDAFKIDADGASAIIDGQLVLDKHNARHPESHNNGSNPISIGFSSHYKALRKRFGEHVALGVAGENVIVETARTFSEDDFQFDSEIAFQTQDGELIVIQDLFAMPPCKPFTRYCLGYDPDDPHMIKSSLQFLTNGMRGFAGRPVNTSPYILRVGDTILLC